MVRVTTQIEKKLHSKRMRELVEFTGSSLSTHYPTPFGSSIYNSQGELIAQAYNTVIKDQDRTCHGEMNALRDAFKKTGAGCLRGCSLYSTCEPCPMCMSACIWAEIDTVIFAATTKDDANFFWRQPLLITASELASHIVSEHKCRVIEQVERERAQQLFDKCRLILSLSNSK